MIIKIISCEFCFNVQIIYTVQRQHRQRRRRRQHRRRRHRLFQ